MTIEKLKELAAVLVPEFKTEPLELLYPGPKNGPHNDCVGAYAIRCGKQLWLRDELQRLGRWQGAWPSAIVFLEPPTVPVLIHELPHLAPIIPARIDDGSEPPPARRIFENIVIEHLATAPVIPQSEPWRGHGLDFIRRALCLHHRAEKLGISVPLYQCEIAGDAYGLSSAFDYRDALCGFESHSENMTFAEIDALPYLPSFEGLFLNDAAKYLAANSLTIER